VVSEQSSTQHIEHFSAQIQTKQAGMRFDQALAELFSDFSRSRLQQAIKNNQVTLNGKPCKAKIKVFGGEKIELDIVHVPHDDAKAEPIALDIIYEDDSILLVNKPAKLVVHPAAGNPDGTLQNALLYHQADLARLPRAGIVHRLDKDTTGLLVIAKSEKAHKSLVEQLQARTIKREYRAVCHGVLTAGGSVDTPIGRHPKNRIKMAVNYSGKEAMTHYRIKDRYFAHSYLQVNLETGRTHQIRVHLASIRHALVGDPTYGGRLRIPAGATDELSQFLRQFSRQALHARKLALNHPETGELMEWQAPLPADMIKLIQLLKDDLQQR